MSTTILITGASSGIGAALARVYAAPGVRLSLWGRDAGRLADVAADCRARGAEAEGVAWDMRLLDGLAERIAELDRAEPVDLAIFNAGVGGSVPPGAAVEATERTRDVALVNFAAPAVAATALAQRMAARRHGHIAFIGSIAASYPFPIAPTYSATKAGLKLFAEAIGLALDAQGVTVTLVSPGFVDTPMSRQLTGPQPFSMTAEAAAAIIRRGLDRKKRRIAFPWPLVALTGLYRLLPRPLRHAILRRLKG